MGYATYRCGNSGCDHTKRVYFGCHHRYCPTCGKKRTDQWIENMRAMLPNTEWQHITFTMPDELWPIFKQNRHLLKHLSRLAATTLLDYSAGKGCTPGLFSALHTFGRNLKWNTHVHLSISRGGLTEQGEWKALFFPKAAIMRQWRYALINLLREAYKAGELTLPQALDNPVAFSAFLDEQYQKGWIVHFAKPTKTPYHTIKYLGRYVSRPPLAMARLKHYDGHSVVFKYLDHKSKTYRRYRCSADDFLDRWTQHIPEKHCRMINYYGFLSHRKRGALLPVVYQCLDQTPELPDIIRYPQLLRRSFGIDPLECVLCGTQLLFSGIRPPDRLSTLYQNHKNLALGKRV